MRSFTVVVLLALALALAAFAPVASADANITLYADSQCSQMLGEGPQNVPIPSAPTCQDVSGPTGSGSAVFFCYNVNGYNNFSLAVWSTASDCSGAPDASITGYGKQDSCVVMSLNIAGQSAAAFAQLQCSASSEEETRQLDVGEVVSTLSVAKRAAFIQSKAAGRHGMLSRMMHPMARKA